MWGGRKMDEKKNIKICFAASSGGHYEQLMMLKPLMKKYDSFIITEKTDYSAEAKGEKTYYMKQVNRREKDFIWRMIQNAWKSIGIYKKEKPDFSATSPIDKEMVSAGIEVISLDSTDINTEKNRLKAIKMGIYNSKSKKIFKKFLEKFNKDDTIIHLHGWSRAWCISWNISNIGFDL